LKFCISDANCCPKSGTYHTALVYAFVGFVLKTLQLLYCCRSQRRVGEQTTGSALSYRATNRIAPFLFLVIIKSTYRDLNRTADWKKLEAAQFKNPRTILKSPLFVDNINILDSTQLYLPYRTLSEIASKICSSKTPLAITNISPELVTHHPLRLLKKKTTTSWVGKLTQRH